MMRLATVALIVSLALAGCAGDRDDETSQSPSPEPSLAVLDPLDSLAWSGTDCAEVGLFIRAPAAGARPFVHPDFTILETQGQATVAVAFARCASGNVLGNTTNNLVMSDVGIYVEDPEGGSAPAFYQFWHASNRAATSENMSRVGLRTQSAPHSNFLTFGLVQSTLVESRIASTEGDYHGRATSVPGAAQVPAQSFRWWHASENGTMYSDFTLAYRSIGPAQGNVSAEAGSDLAKILGGTNVNGEGVYWTFDLAVQSRRTTG